MGLSGFQQSYSQIKFRYTMTLFILIGMIGWLFEGMAKGGKW